MSKLTNDEIEYVATLARIEIEDDKTESTTADISAILGFVDSLQAINTDSIEPISQVTGLSDVWREDEVVDCKISRDDLLSNAPKSQDGYVVVKKVL